MSAELIGQHWDQLGNKQPQLIATFFQLFLERYPEYRPLYPQSLAEMEKLQRKVGRAISLLARISDDTGTLYSHMVRLGDRHRKLGLKKEDLVKFKDVFVEAIKEFCGEECSRAWNSAFENQVIPYMIQGLELSMDPHQVARLVKLQTSFRNQFLGIITKIRVTPVLCVITVRLKGGDEVTTFMGEETVHKLGIYEGCPAYVLIRAPQIGLIHGDTPLKLSASNLIYGTVIKSAMSTTNARVLLQIKGDEIIQAVVTQEAIIELGIKDGERVGAFFHAKDVLLAVEKDQPL